MSSLTEALKKTHHQKPQIFLQNAKHHSIQKTFFLTM